MSQTKRSSKRMTSDERRNQSNFYYRSLMEKNRLAASSQPTPKSSTKTKGGKEKKNGKDGKKEDNLKKKRINFGLGRIQEEIQLLSQEVKNQVSEKLVYNKYYWNLLAVTESIKSFPEHKSGNFAYGMSKQDVVKHFSKCRSILSSLIPKMETLYAKNYEKRFKQQGGKKGRMLSFKDFMRAGTNQQEEEDNVNQFKNFIMSNYDYKGWAQENKKTKSLKEEIKWLKTLRGGGMEEYFKQKLCEQHFRKVFSEKRYPVAEFLKSFTNYVNQGLKDMQKGLFCNVDKLVSDINNSKDLIIGQFIEGYKTQLKGLEKHNFPLLVMKEMTWTFILNKIGRNLIPLFRKFSNQDLDKKIDKLRTYLYLERLPIDSKLMLQGEKIPYEKAIKKIAEISKTLVLEDQLKVFQDTYDLIFQCVDDHYKKHDKHLMGMKIKDTDVSQLVLYVLLNSDVNGISSYMQYIREFKIHTLKVPFFNLFDQVLEWTNSVIIEIAKDEEDEPVEEIEEKVVEEKKTHSSQVSKVDLSSLVDSKTSDRKSVKNRKVINTDENELINDLDDGLEEEEKDKRLLELEKSINEKNLLIELLEKKVFHKVQSAQKTLSLQTLNLEEFQKT